jgi:hypothetical protein
MGRTKFTQVIRGTFRGTFSVFLDYVIFNLLILLDFIYKKA